MPELPVGFAADLTDAQDAAITAVAGRTDPEGVSALARVALDEWLRWLVADDRPASLTELTKRRIKALLQAGLLPQPPTAAVLALRARLTLGQARYILGALALENPATGAEAAAGLISHLRAALAMIGVADPNTLDNDAIERLATGHDVRFDAARPEADLATATHEEILNERFHATHELDIDNLQPPTVKRRTDSYVQLTMRGHVAVAILRRLEGKRRR